MNMTAVLAAVNERIRSRVTGNMGEDVCVSHHMKSGKLAAAATKSPMTVAEVQPHVSPWTSASVRQNRPAPEMTMPGMSMPPSALSLRSPAGMMRAQAMTATTPIGTLTKKIHDQWP